MKQLTTDIAVNFYLREEKRVEKSITRLCN